MPKINQQNAIIRGLIIRGYAELTAKRYVGCRAFKHPQFPTRIIFVGKGGSLRAGQNRITAAVLSERFKQSLLTEGGYKS